MTMHLYCQSPVTQPWFFPAVLLVLAMMTACTSTARHGQEAMHAAPHRHGPGPEPVPLQATPALDLSAVSDLERVIPELADKRVVLVGEIHNRFDHHQIQLEIIRGLHAIHPQLVIGMEAFQQPFQGVLDDYIDGRLSEQELLRDTEYYQRWRYDFRHYAPILRYARENRLPVIALNVPQELTRKVGRVGLSGLTDEERERLPAEIDRSDAAYEARLREVHQQHSGNSQHSFDHFIEVQLLWDEGMAEQAADYLREHPDTVMVVLAGGGHLAYGSGIPRRLQRRLPANIAVILNGWDGSLTPDLADYLLLPEKRSLPEAGKFGALLDDSAGVLTVDSCLPDSPCKAAGIRHGDQFISINSEPIANMADLRLVTWDKQPGETVTLVIRRKHWWLQPRELSLDIVLY